MDGKQTFDETEIANKFNCFFNQYRITNGFTIPTYDQVHSDISYQTIRRQLVWYGMVFIYSTSLYIIYIAHHYNITQDAEREMHEVQYLYVAFP